MRIITGSRRGRRLETLEGISTRPTAEKVKEALFSAIQFDIEGRRVLDLFAGSGQLGLEALSRGAKSAAFVDASKDAMRIITANIAACDFAKESKTYRMDYNAFFLENRDRFDLVFIDPPYQSGLVWHALSKAAEVTNPGGTIICEHPANEKAPQEAGSFSIYRQYQYGKVGLTFYRRKEMAETV